MKVPPDSLRIVLFGLPNAGKSSLLGAVAQAGQTQEHRLGGRLHDVSHGLAELRRRVYEARPRETIEEVAHYPVVFEPAGGKRDIVLIDCDGRVANEILSHKRLESDGGKLSSEVLAADALLLVVDASASQSELDLDFGEFAKFLRQLERSRGRRTEVGDLPVYLVLTKCDLLAQAGDTPAAWFNRIEERKRQVRALFEQFVSDGADGPVPFGRVDLQVWATAVKRPELVDSPARPLEPQGVAELFRDCLQRGLDYRQRRRVAGRRLLLTLGGTAGVVAVMVGLAAAFITTKQVKETNTLIAAVEEYRSNEGQTASLRLREPLQQKISVLTEIRDHRDFKRLSPELQELVRVRLDELVKYRDFKDQVKQTRHPAQARAEAELDEIEARLGQLTPPAAWSQTEAALLRSERQDDIKAIRVAAMQVEDWFRNLKKEADGLWAFDRSGEGPLPWSEWQQEVDKLLTEADKPPFRAGDRLPGSPRIDYSAVLRLRKVDEANTEWQRSRRRLEDLRDLSAALGLAGNIPGRPSLLAIGPKFTLEQSRGRIVELDRTYRRWREWPGQQLPDAVLGEIHRAAETSYKNLLPAGQEVVLRQLQQLTPDGRETPELWRDLRGWLATAADFRDWRELAAYLNRLYDPKAEDPVSALANFLRQDRFDLEVYTLVLTIPDDLKARPNGPLALHHHAGAEVRPVANFMMQGDGVADPRRRVTRYTFVRQGPNVPITYRPGDMFWAELPLTKDAEGRDRKLMWTGSRSAVYQFEKLVRPPRIYFGKDPEGTIAEGASLSVRPETGIPKVPDLMPVVILRKP